MALVTGTESAVAGQPRDGALDHPSAAAEPFAGLDAFAGDPHADALTTEPFSQVKDIVSLIRVQALGFEVPAAMRVVSPYVVPGLDSGHS